MGFAFNVQFNARTVAKNIKKVKVGKSIIMLGMFLALKNRFTTQN